MAPRSATRKKSARYAARMPTPRQRQGMIDLRSSLARTLVRGFKLLDTLGLLVITDDPKIRKPKAIRGKKK